MSPDIVKSYLRGAVVEGVIWGWYKHLPLKGKEWVVNPMTGPCVSYTHDGIVEFVRMLMDMGVTPPDFPRYGARRYE